eukprot:CAMPEP_0119471794 /NCGR_PEP_ID=MMETSP1344-20130328/4119_1 /TAXON_ID=236787 /ORGANISM="Florenciella parvula, Strain CCMP2471" /LENGTH=95 /DNA_ID=CAMNT_0007504631 /DNA_START=88 /DNA_END=378 /DNA_ORIENTATION=+
MRVAADAGKILKQFRLVHCSGSTRASGWASQHGSQEHEATRPDTLNLKRLGVSDQNGHESAWHADLDHHLARSRLGFSLRKGDQGIYCTGRERGR